MSSGIEPGNGERIDKALHAIEEANIGKLRDVFQDISFNSTKLGDEQQKNDILRHLLEDFAKPELNLRPSRIGKLDIIGNAYEYLIKNFASSGGKKAGEFYTPAGSLRTDGRADGPAGGRRDLRSGLRLRLAADEVRPRDPQALTAHANTPCTARRPSAAPGRWPR